MDEASIWKTVHQERSALINDVTSLFGEQWSTQSLCADWTIHDVVAHLIHDAKTTKVSFFLELARAGFNFDRTNQRGVARERRDSPSATLAEFRSVSKRTTSAPAPLASRLVETIVHGEDIRRPLGITHTYPAEAIIKGMQYQLGTSGKMGGSKERATGVRLIATDGDFIHGDGPEVRGSALDLLLALTGRESGLHRLAGVGVDRLEARCG